MRPPSPPACFPAGWGSRLPGLGRWLLAFALLLLAVAPACGGASAPEERRHRTPSAETMAVVERCEALLRRLRAQNLDGQSEETLAALLDEAVALYPSCAEHYPLTATTPVDRVLYGHRADQIDLYALWLELELSRRFDGGAGYCQILGDAFALLLGNVQTIDEALRTPELSSADIRRLNELRTLDLQAIDVLYLSFEQFCAP